MESTASRLTYAAAQTARVAFYGAHYLAARVIARDAFADVEKPAHPIPSLSTMLKAMQGLFAQDWRNIEAGLYPMPIDLALEMRRATTSLRYLMDIPRVAARQKRRGHSDLTVKGEGLPRYFRQNFHFQTGGYLSADSAKLYDFQVEALFGGTADAMRRRAYVPIAGFLSERKRRRSVLLDIGCGTGRFLSFVKSAQPDLKTIALDLSEPYLDRARKTLKRERDVRFLAAPAEDMPLADASVDVAVSIFLFHELPPKIRAAAAKEIGRVLKPGGIFVLADSIQYGDAPAFDGLIDIFPTLLHEPYYAGFAKSDLDALFRPAGLARESKDIAYMTKVTTFRKQPARSGTKRKGD
ncbi:MAG: class I SAM-dependent methyltransferase [Rhizomicrobium sp.]|jgi:ubiquinone/menaquinone biosynthesis C-methylase UbiE